MPQQSPIVHETPQRHERFRRRTLHAMISFAQRNLRRARKIGSILRGNPSRVVTTFVVQPEVKDRADLSDLLNRLAWYLPNPEATVHIAAPGWSALDALPDPPKHQEPLLQHLQCNVSVKATAVAGVSADTILVWRASALSRVLPALHKTAIVDPSYFSTVECDTWSSLHWLSLSEQERARCLNTWRANFARLQESLRGSTSAYVLGTGPSSDRAHEVRYADASVRIVCNSAVKNQELLEAARPQIVTCADPVFHFGPSSYAAEFRKHLVAAMEKYGLFCCGPADRIVLLAARYPELRHQFIGVEVEQLNSWIIPTADRLVVRSMPNVLTMLMLPLAGAFARHIYVLGADGRQSNEKYFWRHSTKNQFEGLMQSVADTHPSFFRDRVYEDYYDEHCRSLESLIEFCESRGGTVEALSPSYIPSLQRRFVANACWSS